LLYIPENNLQNCFTSRKQFANIALHPESNLQNCFTSPEAICKIALHLRKQFAKLLYISESNLQTLLYIPKAICKIALHLRKQFAKLLYISGSSLQTEHSGDVPIPAPAGLTNPAAVRICQSEPGMFLSRRVAFGIVFPFVFLKTEKGLLRLTPILDDSNG